MKLAKLISNFKMKAVGRVLAAKYGKIDYGVVKVAFMVAALDGEVTDDELDAIDALLKKCRGYSAKTAAKALEEASRSAGYLMFLGRRMKDVTLLRAFLAEAQKALPAGFAFLSVEEVRRAVVTWMALGMSDGDYSSREKKCIEALSKHFAEIRVARLQEKKDRCRMMTPGLGRSFGSVDQKASDNPLSQNFVKSVERLVAQYGDREDAAKELEKLIAAE